MQVADILRAFELKKVSYVVSLVPSYFDHVPCYQISHSSTTNNLKTIRACRKIVKGCAASKHPRILRSWYRARQKIHPGIIS